VHYYLGKVPNPHPIWEKCGLRTLLLTVKSEQLTVRVIGLASANFESNIAQNKYLGFYSPRQFIIVVSCYASNLNAETGSAARPTIIVEKLTVKLDAQQVNARLPITNYDVFTIY
jgi:hypothetical protein